MDQARYNLEEAIQEKILSMEAKIAGTIREEWIGLVSRQGDGVVRDTDFAWFLDNLERRVVLAIELLRREDAYQRGLLD